MARTLSDTIIISMIEAATRLAGGRGPISGSGGGQGAQAGAGTHTEAGGPVGQESGATTDVAEKNAATPMGAGTGGGRSGADEHDTRSAEQIGSDFQAIYRHIEEVVKASAEQETKAVGFAAAR